MPSPLPPGAPPPFQPPARPPAAPPWEGEGDPFRRWTTTALALLFRPEASYAAMSPDRPAGPALAYAAIGLVVAQMAGSVPWLLLLMGVSAVGSGSAPFSTFFGIVAWLAGGLVAALAIMAMLTVATHVVLAIGGAARGGFSQTVRAVAYGFGSAAPLFILPYCGWPLFAVAGTVSAAFGLAALHATGVGRAVAALLVPLFIGAAIVVGLLALALANARF